MNVKVKIKLQKQYKNAKKVILEGILKVQPRLFKLLVILLLFTILATTNLPVISAFAQTIGKTLETLAFVLSQDSESEYLYEKKTPNYSAYTGLRKTEGTQKLKLEQNTDYIEVEYLGIGDSINPSKAEIVVADMERLIKYPKIEEGIDLIYSLKENGVKEEVLINSSDLIGKQTDTLQDIVVKYKFNTSGLFYDDTDGLVVFSTTDSMNVFRIPSPFLEDTNGNHSNDVSINVTDNGDGYIIEFLLPSDWLNSKETNFPVKLASGLEVVKLLESTSSSNLGIEDNNEEENNRPISLGKTRNAEVKDIKDKKRIIGLSENILSETMPELDRVFSDFEIDISSDTDIVSDLNKKFKVKTTKENKDYEFEQQFDLENLIVTTNYKNDVKDEEDYPQDINVENQKIKQTIKVENTSNTDSTVNIVSRFSIGTNKVFWDGQEYTATEEPQTFQAYDKTESVVDYAGRINQEVEGIDQFGKYTVDYKAGTSISYQNSDGETVYYDFTDISDLDHEVNFYENEGKSWVELDITIDIAANSTFTLDPTFDLNTVDDYDLRYDGSADYGILGRYNATLVGDVNGDGINDLLIGNYYRWAGGSRNGSLYVIFGTEATGTRSLSVASNYNIRYDGPDDTNANLSGFGALAIGDVNDDGLSDIIVGAPNADKNSYTDSGSIYIIYSTTIDNVGTSSGNIKALDSPTSYNIRYDGVSAGDKLGYGSATGGRPSIYVDDVNGDSKEDLIFSNPNGNQTFTDSGSIYIFYSTLIDDITTTGNNRALWNSTYYSVRLDGSAGSAFFGSNTTTVGDVNGDGNADIIAGEESGHGYAFVIFSTLIDDWTGTGNVKPMNSTSNYNARYQGPDWQMLTSYGGIFTGDVNGDTLDDLMLVTWRADFNSKATSGSVYVVFSTLVDDIGTSTGNTFDLDTSTTYNIRYDGSHAGGSLGKYVQFHVGDVNGDGYSDLILIEMYTDNNSRTDSGSAFVMFSTLIDDVGTSTGNNKDLAIGTNYNIRFDGPICTSGTKTSCDLGVGKGVTSTDVNGDNLDDLIITSPGADYNSRNDSGSIYAIFSTLIDDVGATTGNTRNLDTSTTYSNRYDGDATNVYLGDEGGLSFGDVNNDDIDDLIMQESRADNGGTDRGSVYIFYGEDTIPTSRPFQRKTWYDGSRYWKSYYDYTDARIEFWYSTNGTSWTENTSARLSYATGDYSIEADSSYLFIAYKDGYDIKARATSSYPGTAFTWGSATTVYNGTGTTDRYKFPTMERDSNNKIWIMATKFGGSISESTFYSESADGYIQGAWSTSYNTTWSTSASCLTTSTDRPMGQEKVDTHYNVFRDYFSFDTSSISDTATIASATLSLSVKQDGSGSEFDVDIYRYDWSEPLCTSQEANYDGVHGESSDYEGVLLNTTGGITINTYYSKSVNPAAINKTGDTKYAIISGEDSDYSQPTTIEWLYIYHSEVTGTDYDPKLVVTISDNGVKAIQSSSANDISSWNTATHLGSGNFGTLVSTGSGKMYSIWNTGNGISGKEYNGSTWDSSGTVIANTLPSIQYSFSAVSDSSGYVHLIYIDDSQALKYQKYTTSWQTAVTLDSNTGNVFPTISINSTQSNDLWAFWSRGDTIYGKRGVSPYGSGNWDASPTTIDSSGTNRWTTATYDDYGNSNIFVEYASGDTAPFTTEWVSLAPEVPTTLYSSISSVGAQSGYTNPTVVGDSTPEFSAVYNDINSGDIANKYQVIVYSDAGCTTEVWDSGDSGTSMSNCTDANRCSDFELSGTPLKLDGKQYYWKIRYFDDTALGGFFSDCTANFTLAGPDDQLRHGATFFNNQYEGAYSW